MPVVCSARRKSCTARTAVTLLAWSLLAGHSACVAPLEGDTVVVSGGDFI